MELDEAKAFIHYRKLLAEISEDKTVKEISNVTMKNNGKSYSECMVRIIIDAMEGIGLVKKVYDAPKCVRWKRTKKGDRLLELKSLEELNKR